MYYKKISECIINGDTEAVIELTKEALAKKYPPEYILEKGLILGINEIAKKFRKDKVLVPEVLLSTRAMNAGISILQPYFKEYKRNNKVKIVLGTVAGDLHDIGKNMVKTILIANGADVIDLGVNVSTRDFIDTVYKEKPNMLMMSALLTTTLPAMKEVIEELKNKELRESVKVVVGGTPVTETFANRIGADYYFEDVFKLRSFLEKNLHKLVIE
ncbi:cobalamin B12-binding domain-containing protein [Tepidibacter aestuarii]|uniref:cobalamin B12-binding domain-containing protein n=1 Tax=Tepidibacter aestuarii TaxID=2925782 RepID=UPI0020BF18EF|nr:corrinoid protein [Tepidibacter aestuarii]CAH2212233.1 Dimethylamine corrinoid protein 3 [Tepidibacter aestuarii]